MNDSPEGNSETLEPKRQFKGVWLCVALLDDEGLSPAEKILLAEVDSLTHPEKGCYANNDFLSKRLHVTKIHINGLLSDLTRSGYLIRLGFNGRQTFRCVHPALSSNAATVHALMKTKGIETYGVPDKARLLKLKPSEKGQGSLGKKDNPDLSKKTNQGYEKRQTEISNRENSLGTNKNPINGDSPTPDESAAVGSGDKSPKAKAAAAKENPAGAANLFPSLPSDPERAQAAAAFDRMRAAALPAWKRGKNGGAR